MNTECKEGEKDFRNIVNNNICETDPSTGIKTTVYNKSKRTSTLIRKTNPDPNTDDPKERKVIYLFTCPVEICP